MLNSLINKSKEVAEIALIQLTESLLPSPFVETQNFTFDDPYHEQLLREIQQKYGLKKDDFSEKAKTIILKRLSSELSGLILSVDKKRLALNRLSKKDKILIDLYKVEYGDDFRMFEKLGISKPEIDDIVRNPDFVEHLFEDISEQKDESSMLFLKEKISDSVYETYNFVLQAERKGDVVKFVAAWRVFASDAIRKETEKPSDLLSKFVQEYGVFFRFNGSYKTKIILEETVSLILPQGRSGLFDFIKIIDKPAEFLLIISTQGVTTLGVAKIRFTYVLNIVKYRKSLTDHGFRF